MFYQCIANYIYIPLRKHIPNETFQIFIHFRINKMLNLICVKIYQMLYRYYIKYYIDKTTIKKFYTANKSTQLIFEIYECFMNTQIRSTHLNPQQKNLQIHPFFVARIALNVVKYTHSDVVGVQKRIWGMINAFCYS